MDTMQKPKLNRPTTFTTNIYNTLWLLLAWFFSLHDISCSFAVANSLNKIRWSRRSNCQNHPCISWHS